MKELSIEEKAKRYDEALEKSKILYEQGTITESLCYVFPELKESEDENIRKELIKFVKFNIPNEKRYIAWLEKQGEQNDSNVKDYNSIDPHFGKSIDKVEPFDKYEGLTDFERTLADICIGWIGEELGWKQYIKDNADVLLKVAIKKFNSVQDAPFEQKSAWSEEDESHIRYLIECLEHCKKGVALTMTKSTSQEYINWLKSLRPQNTWKPSDEQMDALEHFVRSIGESGYVSPYDNNTKLLYSLLSDLKKLKG